ncbi:hypothetical protein [Hymenobacter sp.]|uniref:hypothetical protein n=1 Tax=Hymenobacter sp. TaxID=1898978 RepID=UPI00286AFEE7|nr:hypothetical protein [Hymenobacter sp.]
MSELRFDLDRLGQRFRRAELKDVYVVPRANRRYLISDLELDGEERGNECCRCYRNTRKRLRLDGAYLVAEDPIRTPAAVLRR